MKKIYVIGKEEEAKTVESILKTVNAACRIFQNAEGAIEQSRINPPNLFILIFETGWLNDSTLQKLKRESALNSIPVLVCYPSTVRDAEARGRNLGASEVIQAPIDRRELLSRTGTLLHVDRRRRFQTLVTIEINGSRYMGRSEDFSPAGISFHCEYDLPERQEVVVGFFLPASAERVRVPSLIVRKVNLSDNKYFYGARFLEIASDIATKIKNFVEKVKLPQ